MDISAVGIAVSTVFFLIFQGFGGYIDTPEGGEFVGSK